ncbi:acyltransferase [Phocaeicola sp.]
MKLIFYKLLYGKCLKCSFFTFRERFNLTIEKGEVCIGKNVFFNNDCSLTCNGTSITIGDGSIFGENVKIYDHNHCYHDRSLPIKMQGYSFAPVKIGSHCWIGSNVMILKGVTIGDNVVIGAGCIVYKDVPRDVIIMNSQEFIMKKY